MNVNRHGKPLGEVDTPNRSDMFNEKQRRMDDSDDNNRKKDGGKILEKEKVDHQELH